MKKGKVFDREKSDKPLISLILHTKLLEKQIIDEDIYVLKLLKLASFPFVQIICTPTDNSIILDKIKQFQGICLTEYKFYKRNPYNFMTLKSESFEYTIKIGEEQKLDIEYIPDSGINLLDINVANKFDYLVINNNNPLFNSKKKTNIVNPQYALELVRLLLVNSNFFYVNPNYTVNEGYYYLYRYKKIFHEYQFCWSVVVTAKGISINEELYDQFSSLSQRLDFICRAYDKISYFALKSPNNDTQDNTLYHLGYFIMLITGIFDDLAWIIKHLYSLDLLKRDIVLKTSDKGKSKFYDKLFEVNLKLHTYLTKDETQQLIKLFYPIRDTLQHRRFLNAICYKNTSENDERNLFEIPKETIEFIELLSLQSGINKYGFVIKVEENYYFDAHLLSLEFLEVVSKIVNEVLSLIDWSEFLELLSPEKREAILNSDKEFKKGVAFFLGLKLEPIYF